MKKLRVTYLDGRTALGSEQTKGPACLGEPSREALKSRGSTAYTSSRVPLGSTGGGLDSASGRPGRAAVSSPHHVQPRPAVR